MYGVPLFKLYCTVNHLLCCTVYSYLHYTARYTFNSTVIPPITLLGEPLSFLYFEMSFVKPFALQCTPCTPYTVLYMESCHSNLNCTAYCVQLRVHTSKPLCDLSFILVNLRLQVYVGLYLAPGLFMIVLHVRFIIGISG